MNYDFLGQTTPIVTLAKFIDMVLFIHVQGNTFSWSKYSAPIFSSNLGVLEEPTKESEEHNIELKRGDTILSTALVDLENQGQCHVLGNSPGVSWPKIVLETALVQNVLYDMPRVLVKLKKRTWALLDPKNFVLATNGQGHGLAHLGPDAIHIYKIEKKRGKCV